MSKLYLEVVTPAKVMVSQEVEIVVAPGSLGEFGVLVGHVPFLTGILPGELRYTKDGKTEYLAVGSGFAEISDDRVSVLVDSAENARDIDVGRAQNAKNRAEERLSRDRAAEGVDIGRAEASLKRATMRLKISAKANQ
jgi:F-type H+-transporting ATPase subunit epsilon